MGEEERPVSLYDNLSNDNNNGTRKMDFPDIQFKFDDDILSAKDRKLMLNTAKSEFFGLKDVVNHNNNDDDDMEPERDTSGECEPMDNDDDSLSLVETNTNQIVGGDREDQENRNEQHKEQKNIQITLPELSGPSQTVYMSTTVPQNFKKNKDIMGRHKPTRSSLRHSRMLVVNKHYHQRFSKHNSLNLKHIKITRTLLLLKIMVGGLLTALGLGILLWSPNMATKDNPYWAGVILILCGGIFLILLEFKRSPRNRLKENLFNFIKINSIVILMLTVFFTMLAFIYALIHITALSDSQLKCFSDYQFNINSSSCKCYLNYIEEVTNSTEMTYTTEPPVDYGDGELYYRDFTCTEVLGLWYYLMLTSTILNCIGCLVTVSFLVLFAIGCKRKSPKYVSVKTNQNTSTNTTENVTFTSTISSS